VVALDIGESKDGVPYGLGTSEELAETVAGIEDRGQRGLAVEADDLRLFDAVARQVVPDAHSLVLFYAVARSATVGSPRAGSDAAAARFWAPADLADPDCDPASASESGSGSESGGAYRDLHAEPAAYRDLARLVERARAALDGTGP
jgi:hypothetical protein